MTYKRQINRGIAAGIAGLGILLAMGWVLVPESDASQVNAWREWLFWY